MAYKRYIRKGGKLYGPYIYKSIRDKDGNVRNIYVGMPEKGRAKKIISDIFTLQKFHTTNKNILILVFSVLLILGGVSIILQPTGLVLKRDVITERIAVQWASDEMNEIAVSFPKEPESVFLSGHVEGNGSVRIYLAEGGSRFLVYELAELAERPPFTGMAISENVTEITEDISVTEEEVGETPVPEEEVEEEIEEIEGDVAEENQTGEGPDEITVPEGQEIPDEGDEENVTEEETLIYPEPNVTEEEVPEEITGEIPEELLNETPSEEEAEAIQEILPVNETEADEEINVTPPMQIEPTEPEVPEVNESYPEAGENVTEAVNETEEEAEEIEEGNVTEGPEEPQANETITEEELVYYFTEACVETCTLPSIGNNVTFLIEAENGTSVFVEEVIYTFSEEEENSPPEASSDIPNITLKAGEIETLDLYLYFSDPDEDELEFTATSTEGISVDVEGSLASISSEENFTGEGLVTFTASDGISETSSNTFTVTILAEEVEKQPRIEVSITDPSGDINVSRDEPFMVTVEVTCLDADCGEVSLALDPVSIEDFGDHDEA
jgi:hypothetical protein